MPSCKRNILVVLAGPPAYGKSQLASKLAHKCGHIIVSSDEVRKELYGDAPYQDDPYKVFHLAHELIDYRLRSGFDVVFDATSCREQYRRSVLNNLFYPESVFKVCAVYSGSLQRCLLKKEENQSVVSEHAIEKMYRNLQSNPPTLNEGFDLILSMDALSTLIDQGVYPNCYFL